MSRLALNWVGSNFQLPRSINNLEKDFSNGYLFIKMLEERHVLRRDDVDGAEDGDTPQVIMKNIKILGRGLKSIDIQLTKQLIADIISEQPGGAAELIMTLKRTLDGDASSPLRKHDSFKEATRSLKPKTFLRTRQKAEVWNEEQAYFMSLLMGKGGAGFRDVDAFAQQSKYYQFDTKEDKKFKQSVQDQHLRLKQMTEERRNKYLDKMDDRISHHEEVLQKGKTNWKHNQKDKRARQTRDLQFEMALEAKQALRVTQDNMRHRMDGETGIESFESNLKRNGIGGDEQGGEDAVPTAEESDLFMRRLEAAAAQHRPTDAEVGDFMQNLQKRTGELRQARLEKARRKRRMQVEQRSALKDMNISSTASLLEPLPDGLDETLTEDQLQKKAQLKAEKDTERTIQAREHLKEMAEMGETQLRIFCEQQRMMSYETNTSANKVAEVLSLQQKRQEERAVRNYGLCRTMVLEIVTEMFSTVAVGLAPSKQGVTDTETDISHIQLISELVKLQINRSENVSNKIPVLSKLSQSYALDLLPSMVALAGNAGKWRPHGETGPEKIPSFRESAQSVFDEVLRLSRGSTDQICPFNIDASDDLRDATVIPSAPPSEETSGDSAFAPADPPICPKQRLVLVAGGNHEFSHKVLHYCSEWLGGESLCSLWDIRRAIDFASKLLSCATNDSGTDCALVTFTNLCVLFDIPSDAVNSGVGGADAITLTPQTERVIADIVDIAVRFTAAAELFPKDVTVNTISLQLTAFKFSASTLAILLAQVLWLRELVCISYESACGKYPLTPLLLVSQVMGCPDRPVTLKIFDWFLRGGSRLNLPEGDDEVAAEIAAEIATVPVEKGKKKPPPKKKDKNQVDVVNELSSMTCLVWIQDKPCAPATRFSGDSEGETASPERESTVCEPVDNLSESQESRILAAFSGLQKSVSKTDVASSTACALALSSQWGCQLALLAPAVEQVPVAVNDASVPPEEVAADEVAEKPPQLEAVRLLNNFTVVEYIVSSVLTAASSPLAVPDNTQTATNSTTSILQANAFRDRVVRQVESRREKISPAQRMYLLHELKIRQLDFDGIRSALRGLQVSGMTEIDSLTGVLFPAFVAMVNLHAEVLHSRAALIDMLKYPADHWRNICVEFRNHLAHADSEFRRTNTAASEISSFFNHQSRELECELGDINDARHQEWMKRIAAFDKTIFDKISDTSLFLTELSNLLSYSLPLCINSTMDSALKMAEALERSGYSSFPWTVKYDLSRGGAARIEAQRIRDEIRCQSALLRSAVQSDGDEEGGVWGEALAGVDKSTGWTTAPQGGEEGIPVALKASVMHEVRSEHLTTTVSVLKGLCAVMSSLEELRSKTVQELTEYARTRNLYEHTILKKWMEELKKEFADGGIAGGSAFISAYHFGVSDDSEADGISLSSLGNGGLIDANEMAINSRKLKMLSLELLASRREIQESIYPFSEHEFLTKTVKNVFDHGENLPSNWRKKSKLSQLADTVTAACQHLPRNADNFSRTLITRLLYAQLPCTPPSSYTVKLCAKILGLNGDPSAARFLQLSNDTHVKLGDLLTSVSQDKGLCQGWWPYLGKSESDRKAHLATVLHNIEAIALLCAVPDSVVFAKGFISVESASISVDELVRVMSLSPALGSDVIMNFQKSVFVAFNMSSQSSDENLRGELPRLVQPSLSKMVMIARSIVGASLTADEEPPTGRAESLEEIEVVCLRQLVFAPQMSVDGVRWMERCLQLDEGELAISDSSASKLLFGDIISTTGVYDAKLSI